MDILTGKRAAEWDPKQNSLDNTVDTGDDTQVQQHLKNEADINTIVRRFGITSSMPFGPDQGMYGDFTGIVDFESALGLVEDTRRRFMTLPAEVREKFGNNPGNLVKFAQTVDAEEFERTLNPPPPPAPAPPAPPVP